MEIKGSCRMVSDSQSHLDFRNYFSIYIFENFRKSIEENQMRNFLNQLGNPRMKLQHKYKFYTNQYN